MNRTSTPRYAVLIIGLLLIGFWQYRFFASRSSLTHFYRITASSGLSGKEKYFVYFYYYLGLLPVASLIPPSDYSRKGALDLMERHGKSLVMELRHTIRTGDLGQIFLFLPHAIWKGAPRQPLSVVPVHAFAFTFALAALWAAFWWRRRTLLGGLSVALLGSNPFQLYEVYVRENIFGWPITTAILVLAIHVPLIYERHCSRRYAWFAALVTAILLATVRQIRTEPVFIGVSAAAIYLFLPSRPLKARLALTALLIGGFAVCSSAYSRYFDWKFGQACKVVKEHGGHVYSGYRHGNHYVWHPIWCGLGDFDTKYGYKWDDKAAARYALPILEKKYGLRFQEGIKNNWVFTHTFWDSSHLYYKTIYEYPEYAAVIRNKVIHDITHDPLWYLSILAKRVWMNLTELTPLSLAYGGHRVGIRIPWWGLLALGVLVWRFAGREECTIVLFLIPTSFTSLLVYSKGGTTYYACFHILLAAVAIHTLVAAIRSRWFAPRAHREAVPCGSV